MTPIQNNDIALETQNLNVGYTSGKNGVQIILQGLNLSLVYGQLVCFMGPNGVGKSTLLRTLAGVQKPLSGNMFIEETDATHLQPSAFSQKISLVLTDMINAGNLTAKEVIALGRYPHVGWNIKFTRADMNKIDETIEMTGIGDFINKKTYELSDGQLQKVMIARALCQDTPIMILDEPTVHLDLNNRVSIINLLKDLAKRTGKAILIATHELDLALQTADKIWLAGFNTPFITGIPEDLVLNGAIDHVFELKGYDLKTGRLEKKSLGKKVALKGSGHEYLWTKNALERNGYDIEDEAEQVITILAKEEELSWQVENQDILVTNTLSDLIEYLNHQKF